MIDPTKFDPIKVLIEIAADTSAPAAARVSAAKFLADRERGDGDETRHNADLDRRARAFLLASRAGVSGGSSESSTKSPKSPTRCGCLRLPATK